MADDQSKFDVSQNHSFPYTIPEQRELMDEERQLLHFLFSREKPEWLELLSSIKVIARCGCGACPTIMFGSAIDSEVQANQSIVIDYFGSGRNGEVIGVMVLGNEEMPTELAFWSVEGQAEEISIPTLETLTRMPA